MSSVAVLLLASFTVPTATGGKRSPIWSSATIGSVTSDEWCKITTVTGTCSALRDVRTQFIGSDAGMIGNGPYAVNVAAPLPNPVTKIIKLEASSASYTVRLESLNNRLDVPLQARVEFVIDGKYLLLRFAGKDYKTDILLVKKRSKP